MKEAIIFDSVRTPRGKGKPGGGLSTIRPVELASIPIKALVERNSLATKNIEDVILGCVTAVGDQGANIAKSAAMESRLDESVSGFTVNRFCGSGLEAINLAFAKILSGQENLIIAGGIESMSHVPISSDGGALAADPRLATHIGFVPQGISADIIATLKNYSRHDVDNFALKSQQKAVRAWEENRFAKSIIPVHDLNGDMVLEKDEHIRHDTTLESLGQLKPSFEKIGLDYGFDSVALQNYPTLENIHHVHTPGNSSGIVDGASALLIGDKIYGQSLGLKPRAKIKSCAVIATEPTIMLIGPGPASKKALKRAGMTTKDIDLYEVNEAFASVVLNYIDELKINPDLVNVNGGAIAMGHPLGASGAMILGTLLDELERQKKSTGLATLCIGGGMGIATIIELI
ncbi:MAG: acetyl-CoA acetyltransferase [Bdellovibrionales bacterium RBG_16_40_8]|nr:MAG: acetyl-CoA acetyltransferase [Bdellovibrionales bacterium RBG_16_40_8]